MKFNFWIALATTLLAQSVYASPAADRVSLAKISLDGAKQRYQLETKNCSKSDSEVPLQERMLSALRNEQDELEVYCGDAASCRAGEEYIGEKIRERQKLISFWKNACGRKLAAAQEVSEAEAELAGAERGQIISNVVNAVIEGASKGVTDSVTTKPSQASKNPQRRVAKAEQGEGSYMDACESFHASNPKVDFNVAQTRGFCTGSSRAW